MVKNTGAVGGLYNEGPVVAIEIRHFIKFSLEVDFSSIGNING